MLEKTIHRTGMTILSYYNPLLPSFAISYTLKSGSRAESPANNGIHHFIEHMLFKGSQRYSLKEIAEIGDRLGGTLNAFTGKELTQYYLKTIDEKLEQSFDLLSDMVFNSTFPEDEFEKEQNVIIQEVKESMDSPDTHSFEIFFEQLFPKNALGYPIGGTESSVSSLKRDAVYDFYKQLYRPENMVLSISGNVSHNTILELVDRRFAQYPDRAIRELSFDPGSFQFDTHSKARDLNQLYVILGFRGIASNSPDRYNYMVANDILGSGMSSRLFQKIREERGLAYTISSFPDAFLEDGILMIYSIIEPEKIAEYLGAVRSEIELLKNKGIEETELERSKDHIKSSVILGLESNTTRMQFNVNQEIYHRKTLDIKEIIEKINRLKREDINRIFKERFQLDDNALLLYGNVNGPREIRF